MTGDFGLWRADSPIEAQDVVAGWIVLSTGEQRGSIAFVSASGKLLQSAPVLDPSRPFVSASFDGGGGIGLPDSEFALRASKVGSMSSIDWP